ncbi:MAG: hypothetical protein DRI90_07470, partial [Deltaproteobacteria bacterium]
RTGAWWWDESYGHADHHYFTYTIDGSTPDSSATWEVNVAAATTYQVEAFVADKPDTLTQSVPYIIRHDGAEDTVTVNQAANRGSWVVLGTYHFAAGDDQWVKILDSSGEAYVDENGPRLLVDALRFTLPGECVDECTSGARCAGLGWEECGDFDDDSCLEWGNATPCETGTHCEGAGECVPGADPDADPETDPDPGAEADDGPDHGLPPTAGPAPLEGMVCGIAEPGSTGGSLPPTALLWLLVGLIGVRRRQLHRAA